MFDDVNLVSNLSKTSCKMVEENLNVSLFQARSNYDLHKKNSPDYFNVERMKEIENTNIYQMRVKKN